MTAVNLGVCVGLHKTAYVCLGVRPWGMDTITSGTLRSMADRIQRIVDRLYAMGYIDAAYPWARLWHRIAAELNTRGINIYR